jgi:hypothetical protein
VIYCKNTDLSNNYYIYKDGYLKKIANKSFADYWYSNVPTTTTDASNCSDYKNGISSISNTEITYNNTSIHPTDIINKYDIDKDVSDNQILYCKKNGTAGYHLYKDQKFYRFSTAIAAQQYAESISFNYNKTYRADPSNCDDYAIIPDKNNPENYTSITYHSSQIKQNISKLEGLLYCKDSSGNAKYYEPINDKYTPYSDSSAAFSWHGQTYNTNYSANSSNCSDYGYPIDELNFTDLSFNNYTIKKNFNYEFTEDTILRDGSSKYYLNFNNKLYQFADASAAQAFDSRYNSARLVQNLNSYSIDKNNTPLLDTRILKRNILQDISNNRIVNCLNDSNGTDYYLLREDLRLQKVDPSMVQSWDPSFTLIQNMIKCNQYYLRYSYNGSIITGENHFLNDPITAPKIPLNTTQTIYCKNNGVANYYHYNDNKLFKYASNEIASSWDPSYQIKFTTNPYDCSGYFNSDINNFLTVSDVVIDKPLLTAQEGSPYYCRYNGITNYNKLVTDNNPLNLGTKIFGLNAYPNETIASTYIPNYKTVYSDNPESCDKYYNVNVKNNLTDNKNYIKYQNPSSTNNLTINNKVNYNLSLPNKIIKCGHNSDIYFVDKNEKKLKPLRNLEQAFTWDSSFIDNPGFYNIPIQSNCLDISEYTIETTPYTKYNLNSFVKDGKTFKCDNSYYKYDASTNSLTPYKNDAFMKIWDSNYNYYYKPNISTNIYLKDYYNKINSDIVCNDYVTTDRITTLPPGKTTIKCNKNGSIDYYNYTETPTQKLSKYVAGNGYSVNDIAESYDLSYNIDSINNADLSLNCDVLELNYGTNITTIKPNDRVLNNPVVRCSDQSNNYYKLNTTNKTLYKFLDQTKTDILRSWDPSYQNAPIYNCKILNDYTKSSTTYRFYNMNSLNIPNNSTIKCTNDNTYRNYLSNNTIRKYLTTGIAESYDPSYSSTSYVYDCGDLDVSSGTDINRYKQVAVNTIVKCTNSPDETFPYYIYTSTGFKKIPNHSIALTYDQNYITNSKQYDCSYVDMSSNLNTTNYNNLQLNNVFITCSDIPNKYYYVVNNNLYNVTDDSIAKTYDTNYKQNAKLYSCNYLDLPIVGDLQYRSIPNNGFVKCTDDTVEYPYYKYNQEQNILEHIPNYTVGTSWNKFFIENSIFRKCDLLNIPKRGDLSYNTMSINKNFIDQYSIIKCFNETDFPYYKYSNKTLQKFPNDNVALSWDTNYVSNSIEQDCQEINIQKLNDYVKYKSNPLNNSIIKCINESDSHPYYIYRDGSMNNPGTIKKLIPDIAKKIDSNYVNNAPQYHCNHLNASINGYELYDPIPNDTIVDCSNESRESFPYYMVVDNELKHIPNQYTARELNKTGIINKYDCRYVREIKSPYSIEPITTQNYDLSDNTIVKCTDTNDYYYYSTNKYHRFAHEEILAKLDKDYKLHTTELNCESIRFFNKGSDMKYPSPPENKILGCSGESGFPYYYYSEKELRKIPNENFAKMIDSNYATNESYYCDYIDATRNEKYFEYKENDIIKCTNETSGFPYYIYSDGKIKSLNNDVVASSWNPNYKTDALNRDCTLFGTKGEPAFHKSKPEQNSIIRCSNEDEDTVPFYRYSDNNLYKFPSEDVMKSWDPDYRKTYSVFDCQYLDVSVNDSPMYYSTEKFKEGSVIKCNNKEFETDKNTYYKFTNNTLQYFPREDMVQKWNPNYLNESIVLEDCNYLNVPISDETNYKPPENNTTVRCSNKMELFPYYLYNSETPLLRKYEDVNAISEWTPQNVKNNQIVNVLDYDCTYLTENIGEPIKSIGFVEETITPMEYTSTSKTVSTGSNWLNWAQGGKKDTYKPTTVDFQPKIEKLSPIQSDGYIKPPNFNDLYLKSAQFI